MHAIQIQLGEGNSRVDVHLAERAGEVKVDVRTSDSHLAGALRADLPGLTAHLEQTGFHAEAWRPAAITPREITAPGGVASRTPGEPGSGGDRSYQDDRRQHPKEQETVSQRKSDRKDFAWLFTSLR
jgi:hypothetical protein